MARTYDTWGDIGESHYTQVVNELIDILLPLLPDPDRSVLLYAYRREIGYRAQRTTETVRISLTEFTEGRRTAQGVPIDFGAGFARSVCQESLARLVAAGLLRVVSKDPGGRRAAGAPPQSGTTYSFVRTVADWHLGAYWARWSWGVMGRYILAATHGLLPGPRTPAEIGQLQDALNAKATPERQTISLPEVWPISGTVTHGPRAFGGLTVPGASEVSGGATTIPGNGTLSPKTIPGDGTVSPKTIPGDGTLVSSEASGANGIGAGKETYVSIETIIKETDPPSRRCAPPGGSAEATKDEKPAKKKTAKATEAEQAINLWVTSYLYSVYTARGLNVPTNIKQGGITAMRSMAPVYPVEAAVACHDTLERRQKARGQMVIVSEQLVAAAMTNFYPDWLRQNGGAHDGSAITPSVDPGQSDEDQWLAEYIASGRGDPDSPNWYGHEIEREQAQQAGAVPPV